MKYWVTYPLVTHPSNAELLSKEALVAFATTAERVGFDGIGFTDHPAPTHRWLQAGGHDALDPFAALAFVAAVTDRLRLIPNIVVLPYRNPFVVAKAIATIDVLSGGRFTLATATGYLKGEYKALGPSDRGFELIRLDPASFATIGRVEEPGIAAEMQTRIDDYWTRFRDTREQGLEEPSEQELEDLRSLGYVQ